MKALALPLLALVALAACDNTPEDTEAPAGVTAEPAPATPAPEPTASETPAANEIPAAIRGRWGLVADDCTSTRGDAKGLLVIDATTLKFYESLGTLQTIAEAEPTRIRAAFEFEGEGMTWQRDETLDVQDDGATLIRREYGDDAAPGAFRYAKCS
jgi:hypothetical protein